MVKRVKGNETRLIFVSLAVIVGILAASVTPVMATDIFLDEVQGEYSVQLQGSEVFVKFGGEHGTIGIATETPKYEDLFLMESECPFSGCQVAGVSSLCRKDRFSGDGFIYTGTEWDSNSYEFLFTGNNGGYVQQDFDFGGSVSAGEVNMRVVLDAAYAWLVYGYDGEPARIQALIDTYDLSEAEATSLVSGDVYGLIAQLSQFGYSADEVVNLALCRGLDYLRELLTKLSMPYPGGPIDKAAEKYGLPRSVARDLFAEHRDTVFVSAVSRSSDYKDFVANLEGWDVKLRTTGSLFDKTEVAPGGRILASFKLFHPVTGEQVSDPKLLPYANIAQALPDGRLNGLAGHYSYIEFRMDPETGVYYAPIETVVDENTKLAPGEYWAFVVFGNPGNDTWSKYKARFTVTT